MQSDFAYGIIPVFFNEEKSEFEFLLIRQQGGHWGFPKGHKENEESDLETVFRELYEETGYTSGHVEILSDMTFTEGYPFEHKGIQYIKENKYYIGTVKKDTVATLEDFKIEIVETGWFSYEEALKLLTFKPRESLLREVNDYLASRLNHIK